MWSAIVWGGVACSEVKLSIETVIQRTNNLPLVVTARAIHKSQCHPQVTSCSLRVVHKNLHNPCQYRLCGIREVTIDPGPTGNPRLVLPGPEPRAHSPKSTSAGLSKPRALATVFLNSLQIRHLERTVWWLGNSCGAAKQQHLVLREGAVSRVGTEWRTRFRCQ